MVVVGDGGGAVRAQLRVKNKVFGQRGGGGGGGLQPPPPPLYPPLTHVEYSDQVRLAATGI